MVIVTTDLTTRLLGKSVAQNIIGYSFPFAILSSIILLYLNDNPISVSVSIGIASGIAYAIGILIDINAFQFIREKYSNWWIAPALSTIISKARSWIWINNIGNYSISGEIIQGSSESVNLVLENNQLTEEIYSAYLNINSNGSEPISLPVELINLNNMLLGDLNDDSTINISDVVLAVNLVLSSNYNFSADINSDNTVNVSDIILLINLILQN